MKASRVMNLLILCLVNFFPCYLRASNALFMTKNPDKMSCPEIAQALVEYHEIMTQLGLQLVQMTDDSINMRSEIMKNLKTTEKNRENLYLFLEGSVNRLRTVRGTNSENVHKYLKTGRQLVERNAICISKSHPPHH